MIFILDTNVIQEDYWLRSSRFRIFFDYLAKTDSKVLIPKIVFDELSANYSRTLKECSKEYSKAQKKLRACLPNIKIEDIPLSIENIEEETINYINHVRNTFKISQIVGYKDFYLEEVIQRAIQRRRPCNQHGEEIRDALLWCVVKDTAKENNDDLVVFISRNTRQFAKKDGHLHEDIEAEIQKDGLNIRYFQSLQEFEQHHASKIDFITKEWLEQSINRENILNSCINSIESIIGKKLNETEFNKRIFTGYCNYIGEATELYIYNYYVYEMSDGSFQVFIDWLGEIEVEVEFELQKENAYLYDTNYRSEYIQKCLYQSPYYL